MWWDWTQITLLDSVLFSLLSLLILYLVGYGFLKLICALSKRDDPFGSFDFLQKINFRIVFGFGFLLLIVLIFSMLNFPFWISSLFVVALAAVGFVITRRSLKFKLPKFGFKNYAPTVLVFVVLLVVVFLSSMLIVGFYGSTNDDAAYHTLIVRLILDNPNALLTRTTEPYAGLFLNYPSGTHVLGAFFVTVLGVSIQKIVMMVSVILPCLIALSFYSTIKCLFENKTLSIIGLIVAAFFTLGISWGPICWGGLPILSSLYLSISTMGLIFVFLVKKKITFLNAFLLGLIFFIASQTYPDALLIVAFWFLIILSAKLLPKLQNVRGWKLSFPLFFNRRNIFVAIVFLIPILFSVPYLYFIYTHSFIATNFNNINLSSNVSVELVKARIDFNWLFDIPALSQFFSEFGGLLAFAPYSLILLIVLFIPQVSQRLSSFFPSRAFVHSLLLIYLFMLLIMSYLTLTLYLPINLLAVYLDSERVWQHLFIPGTILTAVVIFSAIYFSYLAFKRLFHSDKTNVVKLYKNRILACALLALLIFNVGLLSIPIINEQQGIYDKVGFSFNTYKSLNQDDVVLMKWITQNVPSQERILVSAGDSGQFVTAVTQLQTISKHSYLKNYSDLMSMLTSNASDLRAVPLMIEYNVSYVYIGSTATTYALENPYYRQFNATQFLSTPYFSLTKETGEAWLFQFNATTASNAYKNYADLQAQQS